MKRLPSLRLIALLIALLIAPVAQAAKSIPGVDVIVKKNPGGSVRSVTSDAEGAFTVRGLEAGSYTLTFNPCPYGNGMNRNASKLNVVTRFVINNPGLKSISIGLSRITCAISEGMPLRARRTPQGSLEVSGTLSPEVFAAGIDVEVEIGSEGIVSGTITAE
jgi:Carboxypeptidase regulatory-like domain